MIKAGIIGGAGYTAGELIRLLLNHNQANIDFVYSTSNAGNKIHKVHQDLVGTTEMEFTSEINAKVDVLFLCLGHGNSKAFLEQHTFSEDTKIIDLSNDFRLKEDKIFNGKTFVYGLPELQKETIKSANYIANPGCFATAIQLALLPLAASKSVKEDIHINAVTGATGAGTSLSKTTHFTWRDNNFSYYKPFIYRVFSFVPGHINSVFNEIINFLLSCKFTISNWRNDFNIWGQSLKYHIKTNLIVSCSCTSMCNIFSTNALCIFNNFNSLDDTFSTYR